MTEVDMPGSNPVLLETTAVKDGDDYVINGHKWYTTAADGANFAITMAVTNPDAPDYLQASMIIVPTDTQGLTWSETFRSWVMRAKIISATAKSCFSPAGFPRRTFWVPKGTDLSLPRNASGQAAFITVCDGWEFVSDPLR